MSTGNAGIEDRGPAVFAVATATLALASTFVFARLICRKFIVRNVSWDDRIIILAWAIAFGLSFTIDYGTRQGLGRHDEDIADHNRPALQRCQYVFSVLYVSGRFEAPKKPVLFALQKYAEGVSNTPIESRPDGDEN